MSNSDAEKNVVRISGLSFDQMAELIHIAENLERDQMILIQHLRAGFGLDKIANQIRKAVDRNMPSQGTVIE